MKDHKLEETIKRILSRAEKEGAPSREVIERGLLGFTQSYKTCINWKEKEGEDKAAYHFITTIFPEDLASQQIYIDFYEDNKKKIGLISKKKIKML
ncbi:MAG: hypothetical protein AABX77_02035 [Nanoarchaeota archaeon]